MNVVQKKMLKVITGLLIVALFVSGCATSDLWEEDSYHPGENPKLRLVMAKENRNVLVKYNEQFAESNWTKRRAYWLFDDGNPATWMDNSKPRFVNPRNEELVPVLLRYEMPDTNALPAEGYVARARHSPPGFELWRDGTSLGHFDLPSYVAEPPRTFGRIMLTPLAAAGDVVIVVVATAAVAAVIAGLAYVYANTPTSEW